MTAEQPSVDGHTYYEILGLPSSQPIPLKDIKAAYHRALLASHPDKVGATNRDSNELDLIREAWNILSDDHKRKEYDAKLKSNVILCFRLILDGINTRKAFVQVDLDDMSYDGETAVYSFPCRCGTGGGFHITEDDLEKGKDLVECWGCSSWIRVSYEMVSEA